MDAWSERGFPHHCWELRQVDFDVDVVANCAAGMYCATDNLRIDSLLGTFIGQFPGAPD